VTIRAAGPLAGPASAVPGIHAELLATMPALRGYANSLARHREDAEDLLQDGVLRMLGAADRFVPGSSFRAWAFTILRHRFLNDCVRRRARFVSLDAEDVPLAITAAVQSERLELLDLHRQFATLPAPAQRVLMLAAEGESSYLAIACRDGCAVGTIKSRVHRARAQLRERLHAACN
jgi:RNA polymerase sigma-70 factor (ECF subfamily)